MKSLTLCLVFVGMLAQSASAELKPGTPAPEFPPDSVWIGSAPLTMQQLRGKVVIVDFWEYTCINCIRTFPHVKQWYQRYHNAGLEIIGVQKGEFAIANDAGNVKRAYGRFKLPYAAIADVKDKVWNSYDCHTWPDTFLVDRQGVIREVHSAEGDYGKLEQQIQGLLKEGHPELDFSRIAITPDKNLFGGDCGTTTEEIYTGTDRGALWGGQIANPEGFRPGKVVDYKPTDKRVKRGFFVQGSWLNTPDAFESVAAADATPPALGITYQGRDVYAVLSRAERPATLIVTRDGQPVPQAMRGKDMSVNTHGQTVVHVDEPRMYYVITKEEEGRHELRLAPESAGIRIYSFTFGNTCLEDFDRL